MKIVLDLFLAELSNSLILNMLQASISDANYNID